MRSGVRTSVGPVGDYRVDPQVVSERNNFDADGGFEGTERLPKAMYMSCCLDEDADGGESGAIV